MLGGIGVVSSLRTADSVCVGMLWTSGATFRYVLVVAGSWSNPDWFWYRARVWPSPGYVKGMVLFLLAAHDHPNQQLTRLHSRGP